ncbi:MAG TPA: NADH-quinone oxidoreductase subunit C [Clostridia bacterium]|nr:NADH-quinone oxidoreductase subunit C [Clostridia bacterium]
MSDKIIEILNKNLSSEIISMNTLNGNELYVEMAPQNIVKACNFLYNNIEFTLISMFANDERALDSNFSIYYTFSIRKAKKLVIFKIKTNDPASGIQSIADFIPSASLYEREIKDMYGISFIGMPDERELVFHENWPENTFPLRKEFNVNEKPALADRKQNFVKIEGAGVFEIPVGPVHAGIIEPGHFRFSVAGEPIINLEAKLYYVHKGIEKAAENQSVEKVTFISERISGDEAFSNSMAYCQAIEKICSKSSIPERALYSRTIFAELERLIGHLGDISGICMDVAFIFASGQFTLMRQWLQGLNENLTGSRFLRSVNKPGGIRKDFLKGKENLIIAELDKVEKEFLETVDIIKSNSLFIDRVENTGVVKPVIAKDLNAVGPAGRAAGIEGDVRIDYPYAAYDKIKPKISIHGNGDVNCRMNVKIEEAIDSIRIIREALETMPQNGPVYEGLPDMPPYKFAFGLNESPRGENCHWIMSGENNTIYRYKIRTPSFCNWPVVCHAVKGNIVPDFPLINKSFNLSYSGNDL